MPKKLIGLYFSPLFFGFAFLAPLTAQLLVAFDVDIPAPPIVVGLLVGVGLGIMAQLRGSWLWIKP